MQIFSIYVVVQSAHMSVTYSTRNRSSWPTGCVETLRETLPSSELSVPVLPQDYCCQISQSMRQDQFQLIWTQLFLSYNRYTESSLSKTDCLLMQTVMSETEQDVSNVLTSRKWANLALSFVPFLQVINKLKYNKESLLYSNLDFHLWCWHSSHVDITTSVFSHSIWFSKVILSFTDCWLVCSLMSVDPITITWVAVARMS
jgi:hypothetical protein